MLTITNHQGHVKTRMRCHFISIRRATIKKIEKKHVSKDVEKLYTVGWECKLVQLMWKAVRSSSKVKN